MLLLCLVICYSEHTFHNFRGVLTIADGFSKGLFGQKLIVRIIEGKGGKIGQRSKEIIYFVRDHTGSCADVGKGLKLCELGL